MGKRNQKEDVELWMLEDSITSRKMTMLRTVNSGLIELSWHIGKLINEFPAEQKAMFLPELSDVLVRMYGNHFSTENLSIMEDFAVSCDVTQLREIADYVGWIHIPMLNSLTNASDWPYYANLVYREQLTPLELADRLNKENTASTQVAPFFFQKMNKKLMDKHIEILGLDYYFGEGQEDFHKLFGLSAEVEENYESDLIEHLVHAIKLKVNKFRKEYHFILSMMGDGALDYIRGQFASELQNLTGKLDADGLIEYISRHFDAEGFSPWLHRICSFQHQDHETTMGELNGNEIVQKKGNKTVVASVIQVEPEPNRIYNIYEEEDIMFLLSKI